MTTLLVTNDDGVASPALFPLVCALGRIPSVRAVNALVPSGERSWISKAISRFDDVEVQEHAKKPGRPTIWTASGTPADCANLGIHTVFPKRPDLLVSGINIGLNHGIAFLLGSGTVGAANEGAIAGVPAVAFSMGVERGHDSFVEIAHSAEGRRIWEVAAEVAADIVASLLEIDFPEHADVINVNFPSVVSLETPRVFTEIARVGYDALFTERESNLYTFDYGTLTELRPSAGPTDREVLAAEQISISAIQFARSVDVSGSVRDALSS